MIPTRPRLTKSEFDAVLKHDSELRGMGLHVPERDPDWIAYRDRTDSHTAPLTATGSIIKRQQSAVALAIELEEETIG